MTGIALTVSSNAVQCLSESQQEVLSRFRQENLSMEDFLPSYRFHLFNIPTV
jgi:hypothetical protein